ncbi:CbaC protein [Halobacteria archaeon AArc-dxtr1]|nr:CbaC protein [Halobacteria archaeon AArc-dxtr1]
MRISPAKLLILLAFILVIVVELRTVLAFFGVEVTVLESLVLGVVAILALLAWMFAPSSGESE